MKARWFAVLALALIGLAVYAGNVFATGSHGYVGTTLAKGAFDELEIKAKAKTADEWKLDLKTHGLSDLYAQQNTWDPTTCGGCAPTTGWHTHPGPSLIVVTQGTATAHEGDDPSCTPHVYSASGPNSLIDVGGGDVHMIRNESGAIAKTIAVQFLPKGADRRIEAPDPGNCHF